MSKSKKFGEAGDSSYTLIISDTELKLDCYLMGSIAGGSGTECIHKIGESNIANYLAEVGVKESEELMTRFEGCDSMELAKMHTTFSKFDTDTFVWVETDWND